MTLRDTVANRAKRLDRVKPDWYQRVPLEDGAVDMLLCKQCILGHVFRDKIDTLRGGFGWATAHFAWAEYNDGAFTQSASLPMWREEISARLAQWTPAPIDAITETEGGRSDEETHTAMVG